jgi:8-oxo-dGTP pyrophosphatase MutT (NUDIX family)
MDFNASITLLESKLKDALPGINAHRKYMHPGRSTHIRSDARSSAVLILLYPYQNEAHFPLILRPQYDGTHGGQMALPGGKSEPGDENIARTALREAQEEIGIRAMDVQVLGQLTAVNIPISNFVVYPIVGAVNYTPDFYPDAREVDKIYPTALDDLRKYTEIQERKIHIGNQEVQVPGFEIQDTWVWGATALMLSELSDILWP